jgi:hypothetical protein
MAQKGDFAGARSFATASKGWEMDSIGNIRNLASIVVHTLRKGSTIERIVLGSALLGTGLFVAQKLYSLAIFLFSTHQKAGGLPKPKANQAVIDAFRQDLKSRFPDPKAPAPNLNAADAQTDVVDLQSNSLLIKLSIDDVDFTDEKSALAEALYAYDELRKKINGEEARFVFITESFLRMGQLPATLKWEARQEELNIPGCFNATFEKLEQQLKKVRLSLKCVTRSEKPFAVAEFISDRPKEIFTLAELYQVIKLKGSDILTPLEIQQKKKMIEKTKRNLHESRLKIIQKTLSTVRTLLIDDMVRDFPEKHKELYTIFGNDSQTLLFVAENVCWHALDRALESIEITFVPSKETQQKIRKIDLERNLVKVLSDKAKQTEAQRFLIQILSDLDNGAALKSLVDLLLGASESSERDSLIQQLQQPQLELEERFIHQELGRLQAIQQFYHALAVATAVADEGKNALRTTSDQADNQEIITSRPLPAAPDDLSGSMVASNNTYGQAVEKVSLQVVAASERAVLGISSQRWQNSLTSLDQEIAKINSLSPTMLKAIVDGGWVKFDNDKSKLICLTGPERWLLTKKMIIQRIVQSSLREKGTQLVQEVGKGAVSFIKTLYGRLVTVLLAFDKRTTQAAAENNPKPADRVAKILFDSLLQSYQALLKVNKEEKYAKHVGKREEGVVKELEKLGEIHASATNKGGADAAFLATLILKLLFILQPEGLSADIQKAIMSAVSHGRSGESKIIHRAIEMYNKSIQPAVEPWVKPVGNFLFSALENIIERQSANSVAKQMSEVLNPININSALIDLLRVDSVVKCAKDIPGTKDEWTWYEQDENNLVSSLQLRDEQNHKIKALEEMLKVIEKVKGGLNTEIEALEAKLKVIEKAKGSSNTEIENIKARLKVLEKARDDKKTLLGELLLIKVELAEQDMALLPELLRRIVLVNVSSSFKGYVLKFAYDLHELIQYPRILRHVVFNVMEKAVHTLQPLDKTETAELLDQPVNSKAQQTLVDFIFSDQQKVNIGNSLSVLFSSMNPNDGSSVLGWLAQTAVMRLPLGYPIFSQIQVKIESLVTEKFKDKEALNWSGAKLIEWLNSKILKLAEDQGEDGMTAKITALLEKALVMQDPDRGKISRMEFKIVFAAAFKASCREK